MPSVQEQTSKALATLRVAEAPSAFVTEAWERALVDLSDLAEPLTVEDDAKTIAEGMALLSDALQEWQETDAAAGTFWVFLGDHNCSVKALVAVTAHHIDAQEGAQLAASSLYLRLLLLPGAFAHKAYSPMLFRRACQAIQQAVAGDETSGASDPDRLSVVLCDLARVAASAVFRSMTDSVDIVVEVLVQASRLPLPSKATLSEDDLGHIQSTAPLASIAFAGLYALCERSDMSDATRVVFKNVLRTLNMSWTLNTQGAASAAFANTAPTASSSSSSSSSSFTQAQLRVRDNALVFVRALQGRGAKETSSFLRILGQHLCTTVADRAAHRTQGAEAFVCVACMLPAEKGLSLASWLHHFSRSGKTAQRAIAIEYIARLLTEKSFWEAVEAQEMTDAATRDMDTGDTPTSPPAAAKRKGPSAASSNTTPSRRGKEDRRSFSPAATSRAPAGHAPPPSAAEIKRKLVQLIFLRCSDKAVNVRVRALKSLHAIASRANEKGMAWIKGVVLRLYKEASIQDLAATTNDAILAAASLGSCDENGRPQTPTATPPASRSQDTLSRMLLRRLADAKSTVRKAAVAATEAILLLLDTLTAQEVAALTGRCRDPVLSVRRQALESSHRVLLAHQHSDVVRSAFFESILPLMLDNEETVRVKCTDVVRSILLDGILAGGDEERDDDDDDDDADTNDDETSTDELPDCFLQWLADHPEYRRYMQRGCADWQRSGRITQQHVAALFARIDQGKTAAWSFLSVLATQGSGALIDPATVYRYWKEGVLENTAVSGVILTVLNTVGDRMTREQRGALSKQLKQRVLAFTLPPPLIAGAMTTIIKFDALATNSKEGLAAPSVAFCRQVLEKCRDSIGRIVTTDSSSSGGSEDNDDEGAACRHIFTLGEAAMLCPQSVDDALVLPLQGIIARGEKDRNPVLRAHAYLALGKVCLQREELAKTWISSMARELEECPDAAVRNNIVVIMADLCIRYTTFVERYIPTLAGCLRDDSPLVRRQALMLLTRLLTEDYIKLKGVLFFRLLVTLVDDDMQVRNLAYFCLVHMLYARDAAVFRAHFVESVYHLNDHGGHPTYNRLPQSDADRRRFDLTGAENRTKREYMYRIMLQHCTDVDRLHITQDLCQGVLNAVAEEELPLDASMQSVLADTLVILSSKDIKLGKATDTNGELEDEEDRKSAKAAVKAQLISKIAKKNLVQNILPIVVHLKNLLDRRRSPLQRNIMVYLREVMADHKDEVEELLSANKQLAREIRFDLDQFEKDARSRRTSVMSLAATPSHMSPRLRSASTAPSPFLAGMDTPNFKAPRLRTQPSGLRRQSRSGPAQTPLRHGVSAPALTPAAAANCASASRRLSHARTGGATTPCSATNPLAWVRTPASKLASRKKRTAGSTPSTKENNGNENGQAVQGAVSAGAATAADADTDVIVLESPIENRSRRPVRKWPVPPPVFRSPTKGGEDDNCDTQPDDDAADEDPLLAETPAKRSKEIAA